MDKIGIIAEYNPFHNGHKYHIDKIRTLYKDCIIIAVISSSFTQRGNISILNKWDKTNIALSNGVDIVIELPFIYSSQSADIFAKGALKILNELKVNKIVFGSETNDIDNLKEIANLQINNKKFDKIVKEYLKNGDNYPTSLSKAINDFKIKKIDNPNDLLGISYIKEIIKNDYNITPVTIKRTNNFHGNNIKNDIKSASEIRNMLNNNIDIKNYINYSENLLYKNIDTFKLLKYKIITDIDKLNNYQTVDEGIEGRIKKYINNSNSLDELILNIKTKRYTYNKINRMLTHILTSTTKNEKDLEIDYIRILGFNSQGKKYLNSIKKDINIPLITGYKNINSKLLKKEYNITQLYSLIINDNSLIEKELKGPIIKK